MRNPVGDGGRWGEATAEGGEVAYLRHAALRSAYRVTAECRRSATMGADVGGDALLRERGGDGPQRGRDDRCATTGETGWSAGRTRFQLTFIFALSIGS